MDNSDNGSLPDLEPVPLDVPNGTNGTPHSDAPQPAPSPADDLDADKVKDKGNVAFKAQKYTEAAELYSKAIGAFSFTLLPHDQTSSGPRCHGWRYFRERFAGWNSWDRRELVARSFGESTL